MSRGLTVTPAALLLSVSLFHPAPVADRQAQVRVVLTDVLGARLAHASVEFTSEGGKYKAEETSVGSYAIRLEPGTYEVSARLSGFCAGRRAAFSLEASAEVEFDFQMVDCGFYDPVQMLQPPEPPFPPVFHDRYQEEELNALSSNGLRPLVLFGGRQEQADSIVYKGLSHLGKQLPVVYTYNLLTVRANTLVYH